MTFCNQCGNQLNDNENVCTNCGTSVNKGSVSLGKDTQPSADAQQVYTLPNMDNQQAQFDANNQQFQQTQPNQGVNDFLGKVKTLNNTSDTTAQYDPADIQSSTLMSVLCYFSILVFIPIFVAKDSAYTKFHANQGLILAIVAVISSVIMKVLSFGIIEFVCSIINIAVVVLSVIGIINAVNGKAKELPLIGSIKILK